MQQQWFKKGLRIHYGATDYSEIIIAAIHSKKNEQQTLWCQVSTPQEVRIYPILAT